MDPRVAASPTATAPQSATLLVSFELSRRSWVLTVQPPGRARLSRFVVAACDTARVLAKLDEQRLRAERASGGLVRIVSIHEAGLDGFWLHRWLEVRGVESHVVDPASLLGSGRRKQAKTDRIDVEKLVRALALWLDGDRRACAMVRPPSPEQEDWRRLVRERDELIAARTRLCNRIDGLLANQGIVGFDPRHKEARARLAELRTGDGRALMAHLAAGIGRLLEQLALVAAQIKAVEAERDARLREPRAEAAAPPDEGAAEGGAAEGGAAAEEDAPATAPPGGVAPLVEQRLLRLRAIGPTFASVLVAECLHRPFDNRRQVAAFAGLAPTPYASGALSREQGISKAGNARLRKCLVELAWVWIRYQPASSLSRWFQAKVKGQGPRVRRIAIVALARKLLVALWRYAQHGVLVEGAVMKA